MGIQRNGFYTRGYKTTTEIEALTGMTSGDTVFDTTWNTRKIYDGRNWVNGSQISLLSDGIPGGGTFSNGMVASAAANTDLGVQAARSTGNNYNLLGAVQTTGSSIVNGNYAILQYAGSGNLASANTLINRGNFAQLSTTYGRSTDPTTVSAGTFGVWLTGDGTAGTANSVLKAFIRPVEMG